MNLSVQQRGTAATQAFGAEPAIERGAAAASPFAGLLGEQQRLAAGRAHEGSAFAAPPAPSQAAAPERRAEPARRPEPQAARRQDGVRPPEKDRPAAKPPAGKDGAAAAQPPARAVSKHVNESKRAASDAADDVAADEAGAAEAEQAGETAPDPAAGAADGSTAAQAPAAPDPKAMLDWLARCGAGPLARETGTAASANGGDGTDGVETADVPADAINGRAGARAAAGLRQSAIVRGDAGDGGLAATDPAAVAAASVAGDAPARATGAADPRATHALHAAHAEAQAAAVDAERLHSTVGLSDAAPRADLALAVLAPAERRSLETSGNARAADVAALPVAGMTATAAPQLPGGPVPLTLATPVNAPDFSQALAAQLTTLAREGVHEAELQLNPTDMGPIAVQIVLDGAQAQIDFTAAHADTRQALETSLPALAAALHGAGLTLSGGGVFEQRSGAREGPADGERRGGRGEPAALAGTGAATVNLRTSRGLLDLYA